MIRIDYIESTGKKQGKLRENSRTVQKSFRRVFWRRKAEDCLEKDRKSGGNRAFLA
jgi:hypothetical protein